MPGALRCVWASTICLGWSSRAEINHEEHEDSGAVEPQPKGYEKRRREREHERERVRTAGLPSPYTYMDLLHIQSTNRLHENLVSIAVNRAGWREGAGKQTADIDPALGGLRLHHAFETKRHIHKLVVERKPRVHASPSQLFARECEQHMLV